MKNKLKLLSIFAFTFLLFGCSLTPTLISPTVEPSTEPSVEPSISSITDPTISDSSEAKDEFKLKKINVEYLEWGEYFRGDTGYGDYSPYISETYSVDNVLITKFQTEGILDYTVEFEGCYSVDEIEITTNSNEHTVIYDKENVDYITFERKASFPVKSVDNKVKFAFSNRKDLLPQYWYSQTGTYLDLTITKVKYNNQWIEVTENNRFISWCHPKNYFGYDVIKNTYNEVILDFSEYNYKDYVWLDKGLQQGDSYIFYEECIVTLSFEYDIFGDKENPVEVVRQIQIKFLEFDFFDDKPCFEMITFNGSTFLTINASVKATYNTHYLEFLVDGKMIFFTYYYYYRPHLYTACDEDYLLNKEFESFIYVGADIQIDLTEIIKNHI